MSGVGFYLWSILKFDDTETNCLRMELAELQPRIFRKIKLEILHADKGATQSGFREGKRIKRK